MQGLPLAKLHIRKVLSMTDGYGREITYLRLSVTELCNLRCRYCMPEEGLCKKAHSEMLSEEEMVLAAEVAVEVGVKKIRITGGEPLVKPNILSICQKISRISGLEALCLTTNGLLLPQYAHALRNAGVSRINISLDTLDEKKYAHMTRGGKLEQALEGLNAAFDAGFQKVKINTVLIGGFNEDEIIPLAELTRQYPVDVRFIEMMPVQTRDEFGKEAFFPNRRVKELLPTAKAVPQGDGVARLYRLPDAQGNIGLISPVSGSFCSACSRIRLTADGKLKPCLHTAQEFSLKGLDKDGMMTQFLAAIAAKPRCHGGLSAQSRSRAGRNMNQIGG